MEDSKERRRQPWMKIEVKGGGGILLLGGIFIATALAAARMRKGKGPDEDHSVVNDADAVIDEKKNGGSLSNEELIDYELSRESACAVQEDICVGEIDQTLHSSQMPNDFSMYTMSEVVEEASETCDNDVKEALSGVCELHKIYQNEKSVQASDATEIEKEQCALSYEARPDTGEHCIEHQPEETDSTHSNDKLEEKEGLCNEVQIGMDIHQAERNSDECTLSCADETELEEMFSVDSQLGMGEDMIKETLSDSEFAVVYKETEDDEMILTESHLKDAGIVNDESSHEIQFVEVPKLSTELDFDMQKLELIVEVSEFERVAEAEVDGPYVTELANDSEVEVHDAKEFAHIIETEEKIDNVKVFPRVEEIVKGVYMAKECAHVTEIEEEEKEFPQSEFAAANEETEDKESILSESHLMDAETVDDVSSQEMLLVEVQELEKDILSAELNFDMHKPELVLEVTEFEHVAEGKEDGLYVANVLEVEVRDAKESERVMEKPEKGNNDMEFQKIKEIVEGGYAATKYAHVKNIWEEEKESLQSEFSVAYEKTKDNESMLTESHTMDAETVNDVNSQEMQSVGVQELGKDALSAEQILGLTESEHVIETEEDELCVTEIAKVKEREVHNPKKSAHFLETEDKEHNVKEFTQMEEIVGTDAATEFAPVAEIEEEEEKEAQQPYPLHEQIEFSTDEIVEITEQGSYSTRTSSVDSNAEAIWPIELIEPDKCQELAAISVDSSDVLGVNDKILTQASEEEETDTKDKKATSKHIFLKESLVILENRFNFMFGNGHKGISLLLAALTLLISLYLSQLLLSSLAT